MDSSLCRGEQKVFYALDTLAKHSCHPPTWPLSDGLLWSPKNMLRLSTPAALPGRLAPATLVSRRAPAASQAAARLDLSCTLIQNSASEKTTRAAGRIERNAWLLGEQIRAAPTPINPYDVERTGMRPVNAVPSWTGEPEAKDGPTTDDLVPADETQARADEMGVERTANLSAQATQVLGGDPFLLLLPHETASSSSARALFPAASPRHRWRASRTPSPPAPSELADHHRSPVDHH
jgi:hypothetical protein